MTPLPPPAPIDEPIAAPPTSTRRRLVVAAVAATALGVGGVVVGSQLAAAGDDNTADEPTPTDAPVDNAPVDEAPVDEDSDDDADPSDDERDGDRGFPKLDELTAQFEEFDQCLSEQLPDLQDGSWIDIEDGELPDFGDWDKEFEDLLGGSVTVFSPGAENGDLTLLDFGEGDGTITITQSDGEITISTDGDVEPIEVGVPNLSDFDLSDLDLPDIGFETDPEIDAAFERCASLLPGDGILDMVGEMVGDMVGDFVHDGG